MINQKGIRKSKITRTCLLFLVVILAVSCESFPRPKSASDTLLIIPVAFKFESGAQWTYRYRLDFEGLSQPIYVSPTTMHYIAVSGLPAGSYTWKKVTAVPLATGYVEMGRSDHSYDAPAVKIEIREGTATMAPFLLEATMNQVGMRSFQQSWGIRQVLNTDKKTISDELQGEPAFREWKNGL
ncbi:MAG: hypothetical protein ABSF77_14485 [Spirochaetia bacterium]|jgi:hypothetical protein